jgi:hypothetical protein
VRYRQCTRRSAKLSELGQNGGLLNVMGTSKNRRYFSDAAKLPANDSVSFSFRFMDVHSGAARDRYQAQFFEVP